MLSPALDARHAAPAAMHSAALGRAAVVSLYDELALYPKPGLVSFVDRGSHGDMDASTFLRSLFSLRRYFALTAAAGAEGAAFTHLQQLGVAAESRMLAATAGVNTHRGAIFLLGLLCAAGGAAMADGGRPTVAAIRQAMRFHWGRALQAHAVDAGDSQGARAARAFGLRGAREEAALGFPVLFTTAWPALQSALQAGLGMRRARLHALFATIAVLDDTTLAHRGGLQGLRFGQHAAQRYLRDGGGAQPGAIEKAGYIHAQFVARGLSAGGAADVLAAACWLQRVVARADGSGSSR